MVMITPFLPQRIKFRPDFLQERDTPLFSGRAFMHAIEKFVPTIKKGSHEARGPNRLLVGYVPIHPYWCMLMQESVEVATRTRLTALADGWFWSDEDANQWRTAYLRGSEPLQGGNTP
jgi:hypothetical protein